MQQHPQTNAPERVYIPFDAAGNRLSGYQSNGIYLRRRDAQNRAPRGGFVKTFRLVEA